MLDLFKRRRAPRLIHFSRFISNADGGGGARRTAQLHEALERVAVEIVSSQVMVGEKAAKFMNFSPSREFYDKLEQHGEMWSEARRPGVTRLRRVSAAWAAYLEEFDSFDLALVDDPIYFLPLIERLKKDGIPVVALAHNIESLAREQVVDDFQGKLFSEEFAAFKKCDLVVTISREEDLLMNNFGIKTIFFPYYPVREIYDRLISAKQGRNGYKEKCHYLTMGSAANVVTCSGMEALLEFWRKEPLASSKEHLIVAGYNLQQYLRDPHDINVEFVGEVTNDCHDEILKKVKACIIYQETGSGALTRITELLIAGVPVIANTVAARSYYNINGVLEFCDFKMLGKALEKFDNHEVEILEPKKPDSTILVDTILNCIDN